MTPPSVTPGGVVSQAEAWHASTSSPPSTGASTPAGSPSPPSGTKPTDSPSLRISEQTMQSQVVYELRRFGWFVHHTRPAVNRQGRWSTPIQGIPGFPDLVAVRERVIFLEMKSQRGRLSPEQERWRDVLLAAGQDWRLVRPADLKALYEDLIPMPRELVK